MSASLQEPETRETPFRRDRVALTIWVGGAIIMTAILLRDLIVALVSR